MSTPLAPSPAPLSYPQPTSVVAEEDSIDEITPVTPPTPAAPASSAPHIQTGPLPTGPVLPTDTAPPPPQPVSQPPPLRRRFSLLPTFPTRKNAYPSPSQVVSSATSRSLEPPSEADVRQILSFLRQGGNTADHNTPVGAVLRRLRNRLLHPQWQVCLKAFIVAHAVLRGGPVGFVEFFAAHPKNGFDAKAVREFDKGASLHVSFIRMYGVYLKAWCNMRTLARFPPNRMADADAVERFDQSDVPDLLRSLPPVLDVLATLPGFVITPRLLASQLARPPLLMQLHDHIVICSSVSRAMTRLIDLFFTQDISYAVPLLSLYDRFLSLVAEARPTLSAMRAADPLWQQQQVPGANVLPGVRGDMQRYIDEGCPHIAVDGQPLWTAAARAATEPTLAPAAQKDVDAVFRFARRGDPRDVSSPIGAAVHVLQERMTDKDLRVVLKAQTLLLVLLLHDGGENDALVHYLATTTQGQSSFGGEACVGDERDVHAPLVAWLAAYLPTRVAMLHQLRIWPYSSRATARETAERLLLTLPGMMDAADALQEVPVEISTRASPVARRGYLAVVGDVCDVFKAVVRSANELVGVFFELDGEVARAGLSLYERFVGVRERAKAEEGMFERAKIIDGAWRRPEEIVGGTEILVDMRVFVEMSCREVEERRRRGGEGEGEGENVGRGLERDELAGGMEGRDAGVGTENGDTRRGDREVVRSEASRVVEPTDAVGEGIPV